MKTTKQKLIFIVICLVLQITNLYSLSPVLDYSYNHGIGIGTFYNNNIYIPELSYKYFFNKNIGASFAFGVLSDDKSIPDPLKNGYDTKESKLNSSYSLSLDFNIYSNEMNSTCLVFSPIVNYTTYSKKTEFSNHLFIDPVINENTSIVSFGLRYQLAKFIYNNDLSFELSAFTLYSESVTTQKLDYPSGFTKRDLEKSTKYGIITNNLQLTFRWWLVGNIIAGCE